MLFDTVKSLCQSRNITVAQLEREVQVGNGSIRKWQKVSPSAESLVKVADFFEVSIDFLLGRDASMSKETQSIAKMVETLPRSKKDLIWQYINVLQKE